jgi:hypothetical protein
MQTRHLFQDTALSSIANPVDNEIICQAASARYDPDFAITNSGPCMYCLSIGLTHRSTKGEGYHKPLSLESGGKMNAHGHGW